MITSGCRQEVTTESCVIVIFGGSGDLTRRKLLPAIFRMYRKGFLSANFAILGCSRTPFSDDEYRSHLQKNCCSSPEHQQLWQRFSDGLHYQQIDYDKKASYSTLKERLHAVAQQHAAVTNLLFYLAVPPSLYGKIAVMLGESGLATPSGKDRWVRLVVEKPFGRDLSSAVALEETLHLHFAEEQIFRIDHYLAKETVQNILSFRFANQIFEPLWNRNYIDWVGIISAEELGVEKRAGYYDSSGVLRDMFQNHMMQLLALIAMEPPGKFTADGIRDEKVKLFSSILPFSGHDEDIVLAQYQTGEVNGEKVKGYRQEEDIPADSKTPTFALLKLDLDNWRWQGVPFYLVSGKRLTSKVTRLVIQFKEAPLSMFKGLIGEHVSGNRLVLSIYPEESIKLSIQAKIPGPQLCLRTGEMEFCYAEEGDESGLEAYEKALLDTIRGDHMLFWRRDGIIASWRLLTPILEDCEGEACKIQQLHRYDAGTWGPDAARATVLQIVT